MLKSFIVSILLLSSPLTVRAQNSDVQNYDLWAMNQFLDSIRSLSELPPHDVDDDNPSISNEPLPEEVASNFEQAITSVFNSNPGIKLVACYDCEAMASYSDKAVLVQPSFAKNTIAEYGEEDGLALIRMAVFHEVAHFIHEISVTEGQTLHGNPSLYSKLDPSAPQNEEAWIKSTISHNEVDAYALLMLKKNGFENPQAVIRFCKTELKKAKASSGEPRGLLMVRVWQSRLASAEQVISQLWP